MSYKIVEGRNYDRTLSFMVPAKEDPNMPDKAWEGYYGLVYVCNSLNALQGACLHRRSIAKDQHDRKLFNCLAQNLLRAQEVITVLLDETGRTKAYDEYEKERRKKQ